MISVLMLREDQVIGSLSLVRNALAQFSPAAVEILEDFATPSALAIPCVAVFGDRIASGAFSAGDAESGSTEAQGRV